MTCKTLLGITLQPISYIFWSVCLYLAQHAAVAFIIEPMLFKYKETALFEKKASTKKETQEPKEGNSNNNTLLVTNQEQDRSDSIVIQIEEGGSTSGSTPPPTSPPAIATAATTTATTTTTTTTAAADVIEIDKSMSETQRKLAYTHTVFVRTWYKLYYAAAKHGLQKVAYAVVRKDIFSALQLLYCIVILVYFALSAAGEVHSDDDVTKSFDRWERYQRMCVQLVNSSLSMYISTQMAKGLYAQYSWQNDAVVVACIHFELGVLLLLPVLCTHALPGFGIYLWFYLTIGVGGGISLAMLYAVLTTGLEWAGFDTDYEIGLSEVESMAGIVCGAIVVKSFFVYTMQSSVQQAVLLYSTDYSYLGVLTEEYTIRHHGCFYDNVLADTSRTLSFLSWL